ncbi:hypothetical protein GGX14DRAFT_653196 [Mycena pura]|uniref:Uncharacterized protein n=1 Tax=Mycena pura TaxID=153505 RepID=A0AAD6VC41_9AGAR|nr:hypothetical protein GGX14DRAFT_653196 [Mycena pura]
MRSSASSVHSDRGARAAVPRVPCVQALAHHRLSDAPDVGARPPGLEFDQDGQRRRSFYFAEDSLRSGSAQDNAAFEQSRTSPNMMQRRNVMPPANSTPILQQSSMNW